MFERLKRLIRLSQEALWRNKLRAVLAILGVTVGITVVIVVLSAGQAIEDFITGQVTTFGTDWIEVEIKVPSAGKTSFENAAGIAQGITITTLKLKEAEEIKKHPNIKNYYAGNAGQEVFTYKDKNKFTMIFGVSASFIDIDVGEIAEGRFYTEEEDKGLSRVVVLGHNLKKTLFGDDPAIGKRVKVKKHSYKVVGVMAERGSAGLFSMDDIGFIPTRTVQKLILGVDYITFIFAQVADNSLAKETAEDITLLMRDLHNITDPNRDDFHATSAKEAIEILDSVTGAIKILLFAIALISLIVGGVGIMNVMYVSVAERTFEIGLRKSLGAKSSNILNQFLAEAVMITFVGGVVGIALGVGLTWLISFIATNYLGFDWQFYFSWQYIALAAGMSILAGLISGLYPARQAASLDPIVALRKE
ncbi:ABC transporter permease [Patescibacteria group bacterium]